MPPSDDGTGETLQGAWVDAGMHTASQSLFDEPVGKTTAAVLPTEAVFLGTNGGRRDGDIRVAFPPKTMRPEVGSETDRWYGCYLAVVGIASVLLVVGLTVLVALLFLNLTFVFDDVFVHADVPFYVTPADGTAFRQATRYGVNYVLVALFALKYITVFASFGVLVNSSRGGASGWVVAVLVWIGLVGSYDLAVSVYWLILAYMPLKCSVTNICRAWTSVPGDLAADAGVPNWTFLALAWSSIAWEAVNIVYFLLLWHVKVLTERRKRAVAIHQVAGKDADDN